MRLPTVRRRYATAVLALTALSLTGCSSGHDTDSTGSSASPGATSTAQASPGASPVAASPSARPTSIDDWPTTPGPPQNFPVSVPTSVIVKGYTGQSFLKRLAADWDITLKKRETLTGAGATVRRVLGEGHPTKDGELTVAAFWDLSGDLKSLECTTTGNAPRYEEFLRACTGLDFPGADPKAAATWLDGMKPRVDKVYAKSKVPIMSPLLRSGPTATSLLKGPYATSGTYELRVFGTADAEK
ncbi:hypothetical protein [Streptomyces sp. NPDC057257]|uniref:hypothetical protein n=1 Tax=Streptomyces sp. NPDC057257 TaxID=3346071 RepID=UPI003626C364